MLVKDFTFELPKELIANSPAFPKESAGLLYVRNQKLQDLQISNLPELLQEGDVLVFNNTKVLPAKLTANRERGKVEANLHKQVEIDQWKAFVKPAKKLSIGSKFEVAEDFYAEVLDKNGGEVLLKFNFSGAELIEKLHKYGEMPIPPYIKRRPDNTDKENYQTVFAKHEGAVAAPTAGLHFTEELLSKIKAKNVSFEFITLHVGAGTFLPVKVENVKDHKMHAEYFVIDELTAGRINLAKSNGHRIIPVGTTSLRALESASDGAGRLLPYSGDTSIFITPGYKFKIADCLFTNFHLPESTLFMLVCAFAGTELMKNAYEYAIDKKYRFFSYGDACFLERNKQ